MASITKSGSGWRAQIARKGVRKSATFPTKSAAVQWAAREESEIIGNRGMPKKTLADALTRYAEEISPSKKGARFELLRLNALSRDYPDLSSKLLANLATPDFSAWRDDRLAKVSPGSVRRDLNLLSHVFSVCRKEWKWIEGNPLDGLRKPRDNAPRTRRVSWRETRKIVAWLRYGPTIETGYQQTALAFLIALRTAMRASEVLQLTGKESAVAEVRHKTQHLTKKPRQIPLPAKARRLIAKIPASGWTITAMTLDAIFRKAKSALLIEDLHFHDSRAEALTRLARKVDVMTLARISGHRDLKMLLSVYYRESAEDIAKRL